MQKKTPDYDNVFKTMKSKHKRLFISVIYVKRTERTPKNTTITFKFPDGQEVKYESENVIIEKFTKEYIVEKRLFPYIPFYIARYEKEIASEGNIENAVSDLEYFRDEMIRLYKTGELSDEELLDLMGFVNTIITHITNGNKNEERLVNVMGGTVIETEAKMLIKMGKKDGLDDETILKRMQEWIGLSLEQAIAYLEQYGKQSV